MTINNNYDVTEQNIIIVKILLNTAILSAHDNTIIIMMSANCPSPCMHDEKNLNYIIMGLISSFALMHVLSIQTIFTS